MKHTLYTLLLALAMLTAACGDDNDTPIDKRDVNLNFNQVAHIAQGTAVDILQQQCRLTLRRNALNADLDITLAADQFRLANLPVSYDADRNIYTITAATTPNSRITNLNATIDLNEQIYWLNYTLDGNRAVHATMPEVFYLSTNTEMVYDDLSSYTDNRGGYQFDLQTGNRTATLHMSEILIKNELLDIIALEAQGLTLTPTPAGYRIAGTGIVCSGTVSRYSSGSDTSPMGNDLYYRLDNFSADLDLSEKTMTGTGTLVRCRLVKDPETEAQTEQVVSHAQLTLKGSYYKKTNTI